MKPEKPNIIFINVDQWRGDCLGFAGHPTVETPHLDQLANQGVAFTKAYAAVPSCIAARASIMTGLSPASHGRVGYKDAVDWTYDTTLAGLLANAGYHTQAVGKMHVHPARTLLGFHNVVLHDGYLHVSRRNAQDLELVDDYLPWLRREYGPAADYVDTGIGCNGYVTRPWIYDDMLHPTAWTTSHAVDFLRRRDPTRPFFLFLSYHRPHPPLDPPRDYLRMYDGKPLPELPRADWDEHIVSWRGALDSPIPSDQTQIDRARRAYYAQMTFIDHQINRLTHALHTHGCLENTCILFCADHGDMLFDHGLVAKGVPYQGSTHIPFFLRFPTSWGLESGTKVDAPVELQDVLPTLCDIADVPVPDSIEGRSVLPFCRGEAPVWREFIHGEHSLGQRSNHWLTDGKWKYIWYSQTGMEQLFDLGSDPTETRDTAPSRPHSIAEWRERLVRELQNREEGYVANDQLVVGRPVSPVLSHV